MPTWIPPTWKMPLSRERRLWRHSGRVQQTPYVVMIKDGVVTPYPGLVNVSVRTMFGNAEVPNAVNSYVGADSGSGEGGRAVWYGGRTYTITDAEAHLLLLAGYALSRGWYSDIYHDAYR